MCGFSIRLLGPKPKGIESCRKQAVGSERPVPQASCPQLSPQVILFCPRQGPTQGTLLASPIHLLLTSTVPPGSLAAPFFYFLWYPLLLPTLHNKGTDLEMPWDCR